jgi:hypothetical protein
MTGSAPLSGEHFLVVAESIAGRDTSPAANAYWPVASLTHFVVKLVFAVALSFLSCAAVSQDA